MIKRAFFNRNVVWSVLFVLATLLIVSCEPMMIYQNNRREVVPLDHILIPPTKRTDYIGLNIEDSIAIFYTFKPTKFTIENVFSDRPETDCVWYAQWYRYKEEYWLLLRAITGRLSSNEGSFASIHLQMSPKDWVVHKASVYFYDKPIMQDLYIPSLAEDEDVRRDMSFFGLSLAARENLKVYIYKNSSQECIKGVITGFFSEWSSFYVQQSISSAKYTPPYYDFYPMAGHHWGYSPIDTPKKFQLSFTAVEAFKLNDISVMEE